MTMTISQGLRRIRKLKGQLGEHLERAAANVTFEQAQHDPAFNFATCMEQAAQVREELLALEAAVAIANAATTLEYNGRVVRLAYALRVLAELRGEIAWTNHLTVRAQDKTMTASREHDGDKYVTVTRTFVCKLPEAKKAARVTELQDRFDRLNDTVETLNHKTMLDMGAVG